jgi:hypothetical protein
LLTIVATEPTSQNRANVILSDLTAGVGSEAARAYENLMGRDPADIAALERRLRASRPHPDPRFVGELEEYLLPRNPEPPRRQARRPLLAAAGATAALAVALVGVGLAGGGPLAPSGDEGVRAKDDCRFLAVRERVRSPVVVSGRDGRAEVRYRSRLVTRQVKRCR